jgi:hypothetical protein
MPGAMKLRTLPILVLALGAAACGSSRTAFQRYPGAPPTFDRAGAPPQAVAVADKVVAAAGGMDNWNKAKQIRWAAQKVTDGKVTAQGEAAWDRWNGRIYGRVETPEGGEVAVRALYGDYALAFVEAKNGQKETLDGKEKAVAADTLWLNFQLDVTAMMMPFLLEEPGAKLEYAGERKDGDKAYHDLKLSFPDADKPHAGLVYHALVDETTNLISRVEVEKPATGDRVGFELSDWTDAGGLKFPATRKNLGSGELAKASNIRVGDPDDALYTAPL